MAEKESIPVIRTTVTGEDNATAAVRLPGGYPIMRFKVSIVAAASFVAARPHLVRYAVVGLICTSFQLLLFRFLLWRQVSPLAANSVAFLVSAQVNFVLSHWYTWANRRSSTRQPLWRLLVRCLAFNAAAAGGLGVNAVVFLVAHSALALPPLTSALAAVVVSTGVVYVLSSLAIFPAAAARAHSRSTAAATSMYTRSGPASRMSW